MQKILYFMLFAVLIAGGLSGCMSGNKNNIEETIVTLSNELTENTLATEIIEDEYVNPINNYFNTGTEIFLNPATDINTRIETFVSTMFYDPKIVFFDNFDGMNEELNRFIFHIGLYRGVVYQQSGKIGEGLTKEMIEANIQAIFGADVISKLDYGYICADYDEERGIYIPWVYGAPNYALRYIFYGIENIDGNLYRAVVSYIDTNGFLLSFSADGSGGRIIPGDINDRINKADLEDSAAVREEGIEEFKKEILQNPEKYERMELYLEFSNDYIHLLSAKKYTDPPSGDQIAAAYASANEAMCWFKMYTMPMGIETIPNMPAPEVPIDPETGAARVYHSTIKTYNDLKDCLQSLFSIEIADELLSTEKYFDKDGELYGISSDRGSNTSKGKETYEIIRESGTKIIYRVMVEDFGTEDLETVVGYTVHDMIYEYIGGKWVFTKFELVR